MRLAVLGVGTPVGRRVASDLAERGDVELIVSDGSSETARSLASQLGSDRCTAAPMPTPGAAEMLAGSDVAIGCADHSIEEEVELASAAIVAKVAYISACEDPAAVEALLFLDEAARDAATLVVPGLGWSPGMTNVLARAGADALDEVHKVRIAWTLSAVGAGGDAGVLRAMRALSGYVTVFEDGGWHREAGGSRTDTVFFPEPIGWRRVHVCSGAEVLTLPRYLPGIHEVAVKGSVTEGLAGAVARRLSQLFPLAPSERRKKVASLCRPALSAMGQLGGARRSWSAVRVDVTGVVDDHPHVQTLGVLDHTLNLASAPLEVAALKAARGEIKGAGVAPPEEVVEPLAFFAALAELGVRVARLDR